MVSDIPAEDGKIVTIFYSVHFHAGTYMTLRKKEIMRSGEKNETHYWKPMQKSREVKSKGSRLIFPETI